MIRLTNKEEETIIILAEECSEVIQLCMKIRRFGFNDKNPNDPKAVENWKNLEQEIGDVIAMIEFVLNLGIGVTEKGLKKAYLNKLAKLKKYSKLYDKSESS